MPEKPARDSGLDSAPDGPVNAAWGRVFQAERLTVGLMTPFDAATARLADLDASARLAALADELGFAALWTREVPLMIPQGSDQQASALDDPFLWLAWLASATRRIALGTAAVVLPLRHPLHVAKSALSLDRMSGGRLLLGMGSGDRPEEFASFGQDLDGRAAAFRERWALVRAALSPDPGRREPLLEATGGYDLMPPPEARIPAIVVGSSRQTLQWIAANADAWATYHRDEVQQRGRIGLWQQALEQRAGGEPKPFVQSALLDLLEEPSAPAQPLDLGLRTGRDGLVDYLRRMRVLGVAHVMFGLVEGGRPAAEVIREIGEEVLPVL